MERKSEASTLSLHTEEACSAAPGNKTSFISALMGNRGKVSARSNKKESALTRHLRSMHSRGLISGIRPWRRCSEEQAAKMSRPGGLTFWKANRRISPM